MTPAKRSVMMANPNLDGPRLSRITLPCEPWQQPDPDEPICMHPGCNAFIARGSASMVCRMHLHRDYCRCRTCRTGKTGVRR